MAACPSTFLINAHRKRFKEIKNLNGSEMYIHTHTHLHTHSASIIKILIEIQMCVAFLLLFVVAYRSKLLATTSRRPCHHICPTCRPLSPFRPALYSVPTSTASVMRASGSGQLSTVRFSSHMPLPSALYGIW